MAKARVDHPVQDCLAVAAIDFGTACSGYAFCLTGDGDNVIVNKNWGTAVGMTSMKTPTSVLTELGDYRRHKFLKFGIEAEQDYARMLSTPQKDEVCLFNRFKMKLHTDSKSDPMTHLADKRGIHEADSIKIFSMALRYMKEHLLAYLNEQGTSISSDYIRWVLTVPAIWSVKAKSFMRKAAYKAGLIEKEDSLRLLLALEPEAASMFCKSLKMNSFVGEQFPGDLYMPPETVYAIVDAGGGTVDITVHEVLPDDNVKEVCAATGGAWGGTSIDRAFVDLLKRLWGVEFVELIQADLPSLWWDIENHFEKVKRMCTPDMSNDYNLITINFKMAQRFKEVTGKDITDVEGHGLSVNADYQLVAAKATIHGLFMPTVRRIVDKLEEVSNEVKNKKMDYMFLVGGLNCSRYLTDAVKEKFGKQTKVLIPDEPELAVLKGAIKFGQRPDHITSRIAQRTYGLRVYKDFDPAKHPASWRVIIEGQEKCRGVFSTLVKRGQRVEIGEEITKIHHPLKADSTSSRTRIYMSDQLDVKHIDDPGVEFTGGDIKVPMPDTTGGRSRKIEIKVKFGLTEIEARARDKTRPNSPWIPTVVQFAVN